MNDNKKCISCILMERTQCKNTDFNNSYDKHFFSLFKYIKYLGKKCNCNFTDRNAFQMSFKNNRFCCSLFAGLQNSSYQKYETKRDVTAVIFHCKKSKP